jgi:NitT/TauT family transport system substrate-binding protein
MRTFRTFTRVVAGLVAGLALAGAAHAGKMSIGHTTWVGYGPLYLARELGYFKAEGLNVDLRVIEEGSLIMTAVAGGNLDADASTLDEIMKYRAKDFCFKVVLVLDESHGGDGVLVAGSEKSVKDLKGKTVALNEGSTSQFWFSILLAKEGMTPSDVKVSNMTADDAAAAFLAKRVPVAVTWEPHLSLARKKKQGRVLIDSSATPGTIVDVVALRCDYIEKHPADVAALVKGYYKAIEYMKKNQTKAYAIMAKGVGGFLKDPKDFADAAKGVRFFDKPMNVAFLGTPENPGASADLIKLGSQVWSQLGKLKMDLDYATLIEPGFATK